MTGPGELIRIATAASAMTGAVSKMPVVARPTFRALVANSVRGEAGGGKTTFDLVWRESDVWWSGSACIWLNP
ncbi:MAG: hypothetical protein ACR2QM_16200 [Longimicrobiales bacterium]